MKILIPGGHLTPALGLIDWIQEHHPETEFLFVGRLYSQSKLKQKAVEYDEVRKRGVQFIAFESVRFTGSIFRVLLNSLRLAGSVFRALEIFLKYKPTVVMSFGGYLAVPIVIAAKILHIPVLAHEGTSVLGKANKLIFKFADRLAYSYQSFEKQDLMHSKMPAIRTGTPLRREIEQPRRNYQPAWFPFQQNNQEILLVLGGNQGSFALNELIKDSLTKLTKEWIIVHQCGRPNKDHNYRQDLLTFATSVGVANDKYFVHEWINEADLAWLYRHATATVSRAGANTIEEMIYHQVPAIYIPLPFSHYQEQWKNAVRLEKMQAGIVLNQEEASTETLIKSLSRLLKNRQAIIKNLLLIASQTPENPSQQLYFLLENLVQ